MRIGWGLLGNDDDVASDDEPHTQTTPVASQTAPRGVCPTTCPIRSCPDSFITRTRRALVSHLAAKHTVHGERIPSEVLQSLGVRLCGDPCRTLVPITARCRNCRAPPVGPDTTADSPQVPVPMSPPPAQTPTRPGTALTSPSPKLVPTFEEVFAAQVSTVRHIPAMCRAAVADELARLVSEVAVPSPTWEALHRLMCFPKLVMRSSNRGGQKHHHQATHDMERRLQRFQAGQLADLWREAQVQSREGAPDRVRTRQQARLEEDGELPASQVGRIRALIEEGALSKATKLLLSEGLANSSDPSVRQALLDLHPPAQAHLVPGDDLPTYIASNAAFDGDRDAQDAEWTKVARRAISSFPPGSARGPSGLRPVHLSECCRKMGQGAPLAHALGQFARVALGQAFPAPMREVLCASSLIPLRKKDGGLRPIAVGDTIRRVVGKCLLSHGAVQMELASLRPRQCGVGVRNAAEMVGMGLQRFVESRSGEGDRDFAVLQVDVRNAFNSISRDAILRGCMAKVPSAYNWLRFCYGGPSPLFCQGRRFCESHVGVHQGDACGPLGFALGLDTALDQCEARVLHWESWYLDDGHIVGSVPSVLAKLSDLKEALQRVGLRLNLGKCRLWGPGFQVNQEGAPFLPPELAPNHPSRCIPIVPFGGPTGITALGVPVDAPKGLRTDPLVAPECAAKWQKAVDQTNLLLERLRLYPESQVRLTLLRYCLDACRVIHLLRSTQVEVARTHPAFLRAKLQEAVQDLLALGVNEATWEQVCLPTRLGGLGISDPFVVQPAARLAALLNLQKNGTDFVGVPLEALATPAPDLPATLNRLHIRT